MPMIYCQDCGEKIPENAKFCPRCGFRFDEAGSSPPPFTLTKSTPSAKKAEEPEIVTPEKTQEPDRVTLEKSQEPERVTLEKSQEPERVTLEKSQEPERVTLEKSQEPERVTLEKSQKPERVTLEKSQEPERVTPEKTQTAPQTSKADRPFSLQPPSEKRTVQSTAASYTPPKHAESRPAYSYTPPQNDNAYSSPMTYDRNAAPRVNLPSSDVVTIRKNSKAPIVIIIIVFVLILAGAGAFVYFFFFHNKSNNDAGAPGAALNISYVNSKPQWTKSGGSCYNELTSDRGEPFAVAVTWKPADFMETYKYGVQFVYMENGKGKVTDTRSVLYDEDPSVPEVLGYAVGETVGSSFVSSCETIHCVSEAGHTVKLNIKTSGTETGILFCNISSSSGSVISEDQAVVLINGESRLGFTVSAADNISEGDKLTLTPEYFVAASALESTQYRQKQRSVASKFSTRYYAWEINESYEFGDIKNGISLYKTDVVKGDPIESDTVPTYGYELIRDGKTALTSLFRFDNSAVTPEFSMSMPAYIPLSPLSGDNSAPEKPYINDSSVVVDKNGELDLRGLCYECEHYNYSYTTFDPDDTYVVVDTNPLDIDGHTETEALAFIEELNRKLGFRSDLIDEMKRTTSAVSGNKEESDKALLEWNYYPDTGLEVRYEKK